MSRNVTRVVLILLIAAGAAGLVALVHTPQPPPPPPPGWSGTATLEFEMQNGRATCLADAKGDPDLAGELDVIEIDLAADVQCGEAERTLLRKIASQAAEQPIVVLDPDPDVKVVDWIWLGEIKGTVPDLVLQRKADQLTVTTEFDRGDFGWREDKIDGVPIGFTFQITVQLDRDLRLPETRGEE